MLKSLIMEEEFNKFLHDNQNKLILVKFFTTWCLPCRELNQNIEKLLLERKDLAVLEIDAKKFPKLSQKIEFNVNSVPTLFLFRQGKMVKNITGLLSVLQLKQFIDS